jgi:mycothiol synthase
MSDKIIEVAGRYTIRPTQETDFESVLALIQGWEIKIDGYILTDADNLRQEWNAPQFELSQSTRVAHNPDGKLIGYCEVGHDQEKPVRPHVFVVLDAENPDEGLASQFFQWGERELQRVFPLVPDHAKITLVTDADTRDEISIRLIEQAGFKATGQVWQKMVIEMDSKPDLAYLDPAVTIITGDIFNDDRKVYEAHQDSFQDHRNYVARNRDEGFKRWKYWFESDTRVYDRSLWFLALIDGEIAGIALCNRYNTSYPDEGYVSILGVVRPYRGRGIAKYLLVHAFREFWERDKRKVSLYVDGSSITGANKLYVKAGMRPEKGYATYEKLMRDGEELSVQ